MAEKTFFKNFPGMLIREKVKLNNKLVIFLIFIGIATLIWFLWTLEKEYTTEISNPVEYSGFPKNVVLVNDMPNKIRMEVKGRGYNILRHNWDLSKNKIKINFEKIYPQKIENADGLKLTLSLTPVKSRVSSQLNKITVNSFNPDTVSFSFARMKSKKVPVKADIELELEKQYMLKGGVITKPDSIEIFGPSILIDTLKYIYSAPLRLKKVDTDIKRNLAVVLPHSKISSEIKRVQVEIPIEQFTEKNLSVPITGLNVPDSLELKLFPADANLTFRVVVSEFENIQSENFVISADYNQITVGSLSKLAIKLEKHPDFIENVKFNPETVSFILEKK